MESELIDELVALRRGWALQTAGLVTQVGPRLAALCGVTDTDPDRVIRQKIRAKFAALTADLPPDLRLAINVGFALDPRAQNHLLTDRISWLATELRCAPRTARRRLDHAINLLAQAASQEQAVETEIDPEKGWHVRRFKALLRLDTPTPELYEERTIVATRDNVDEIWVRFSLPRARDDRTDGHNLLADAHWGVQITQVDKLGEAHFRYHLTLPAPLRRGAEHEYTMVFRVPENQPMQPYYVFLPLVHCESFTLRVRFDPYRPPKAVWRLDRVPPVMLEDQQPGTDRLQLDGVAELHLAFADPEQGFAYGLGWLF